VITHQAFPVLDDYAPLIPAKLPVNRVPDPPEQVRKPLCVVSLRGMATAFCDTEDDAAFYARIWRRSGGALTFAWSEAAGVYVLRN